MRTLEQIRGELNKLHLELDRWMLHVRDDELGGYLGALDALEWVLGDTDEPPSSGRRRREKGGTIR